ncbi:type VI secretion system contractile sheath protein TssC [Fibrisoma montanum]|uniref:Type VI secretion system contractile sheath protein TssC n=1 Tax=Fibrisoma montanum TaxID=2305895 RepID=A0A418MF69_9BACT|nr:type VI secretion system contractile sheath protein TssC [Fibrisoma montanum]RIV25431.1 type VI secretion system contractile sheath protein TssC [Fibrisoma montanum]
MAETQQSVGGGSPTAERTITPTRSFDQNIQQLQQLRFGGFKLLETTIDGADNLNPERRAKKNIFLKEESRQEDREALKQRLELWKELLLKEGTSITDMADEVTEKQKVAEELFRKNLADIVGETREYESTYRGITLFFENAKTSGLKLRNAVFMNATSEQLDSTKITNKQTIDHIENEIHQVYNRFDLGESYSLLVVPGYLHNRQTVDKWAKIASDHKLMLITDYRNVDSLKDMLDLFHKEKIASDTPRNANVLMACNHLVGRGRYDDLDEDDDLYIEPSSALAGKIYSNLISQVSAGYQYGTLEQVDGVRLDLLKTEVGELEGLGLIPMTKEWGRVVPFSGKTLYTGNNLGLKTYSVVRVFDWIMKVLMQFLNKRAMENWNTTVQQEIQREIVQFLDKIKGPGKIIERFEAPQFRRDPTQKDRIYLDIHITPFFPAKTFVIGLTGEDGRDPETGRRKDFSGEVTQK